MTHATQGSGRGLFRGLEFLEIFIGVLVEGFDATLAAETDELSLIEAINGFSHATEVVTGYQTGGEGVGFGQFSRFGFFFWSFDDLRFGCLGRGGCLCSLKVKEEGCC